mmetsp:Transcript_7291/g.22967  ORF Transcript_7291/g.22967 Transcript_7291/m.22967 type:complete len:139 (-) Transcript_7291:215-631(-)
MGADGAEQYDGLRVVFISGHNPELVVFDDEVETKRVDLTTFKSADDLHALLRAEGFARRESDGPPDTSENCKLWAQNGECAHNAVFMGENCPRACQNVQLVDKKADCASWAATGECTKNKKFMRQHCAKACVDAEREL